MTASNTLTDPDKFPKCLYEKMTRINPGVQEMELYEFRYALNNLEPENGSWDSVEIDPKEEIEKLIRDSSFFSTIQLKPKAGEKIVLDEKIVRLTNMLFVGLVKGDYSEDWINRFFYFDIRGFYFLVRTGYFTNNILTHFGGKPYKQFEHRQKKFECSQSIGYKEFRQANTEVDQFFIDCVKKLIRVKGIPILLAIAGPTAAGKTEIVEQLRCSIEGLGFKVTSIELDNFLTDRDYREQKGIHTLGKEALHLKQLEQCLEDITHGKKIAIPRYDFVFATSSHDLDGNLKAGCKPILIEPADVVFIEGNFPFLIEEIADLISIKVVYLTDDPIRLKRKWKRDIDYRKKYEPTYFRNRFFKDQFLMAEKAYRPQMEVCDMTVDTTGASVWVTPEIIKLLGLG